MNGKLSVIIPLYNSSATIESCMHSVIKQSYDNLEIIIIDDGSQDDSYKICESINDNRIKLFRQKNGGVCKARNLGIDKATGEYITFVDADDWLEYDTYEKMMNAFASDNDVDIVVGGFIRQKGEQEIAVLKKGRETVMRSDIAILELLRNRIFRGELCDKVYRRTLFANLRLDEDIAIAEDLLMNWQLFHKARKVYYVPIWGYHYVINDKSVCHVYKRKNLSHVDAIEKIMSMPDKSNYVNKIVKGIFARALASNILKMIIEDEEIYKYDIERCQYKLRRTFFDYIFAPCLSLRQRIGIVYAILPMKICCFLKELAKNGQRNL